jgi:hypothetical protein
MKRLSLLLVLGVLGSLHAATDSFSSERSLWRSAIPEAKPYTLEVAYGEISVKDGSPGFSDHPSEEFLEVARRLRVGVTPDDRGTISADDWPEFSYWIEDDLFLNLYLRTELGGNREINTRIHLDKNEWVVGVSQILLKLLGGFPVVGLVFR